MNFKPKFIATGIGSMPFTDPEYAVTVSLQRFPKAPFWPQLPKLGLREQMEIQYSEGMPCIQIDSKKGRMFFDTSGDTSEALAAFYEKYMQAMDSAEGNGDCSAMAISSDFARGLNAFLPRLDARSSRLPFVKVQTTGPCSFSLTIVDEQKRAIYYNEEFRDVVAKALAMKCRWQIQKVRAYADQVICFVDEPILSAFGSSTYVTVKREDIVAVLGEVIAAAHADQALVGVHCCGNTEWSILVDAGADILNFDAFGYGETIAMYADAVRALLQRGGAIAWGIIPTSIAIREQTADSLVSLLEQKIDYLAARGIDKQLIREQSLITPSCGTGSMEPADAEKVFAMTELVSNAMRAGCGF